MSEQYSKEESKRALLNALGELDQAEYWMQIVRHDNQDHDRGYVLRLIDNLDLIHVYIRQIERIVKEI